tara:strand:- start:149 stop:472 length:324 start_codon:yes stop_codon:yes gene_type:complete
MSGKSEKPPSESTTYNKAASEEAAEMVESGKVKQAVQKFELKNLGVSEPPLRRQDNTNRPFNEPPFNQQISEGGKKRRPSKRRKTRKSHKPRKGRKSHKNKRKTRRH